MQTAFSNDKIKFARQQCSVANVPYTKVLTGILNMLLNYLFICVQQWQSIMNGTPCAVSRLAKGSRTQPRVCYAYLMSEFWQQPYNRHKQSTSLLHNVLDSLVPKQISLSSEYLIEQFVLLSCELVYEWAVLRNACSEAHASAFEYSIIFHLHDPQTSVKNETKENSGETG